MFYSYLTALSTAPAASNTGLLTATGIFVAGAVICTVWHLMNPNKVQLGIGVLCLCAVVVLLAFGN